MIDTEITLNKFGLSMGLSKQEITERCMALFEKPTNKLTLKEYTNFIDSVLADVYEEDHDHR